MFGWLSAKRSRNKEAEKVHLHVLINGQESARSLQSIMITDAVVLNCFACVQEHFGPDKLSNNRDMTEESRTVVWESGGQQPVG